MYTHARQAEVEAASLWVTEAANAVSVHREAVPLRKCGISTGAMRIRAPLPADNDAQRYQGRTPLRYLSTNPLTAEPMP